MLHVELVNGDATGHQRRSLPFVLPSDDLLRAHAMRKKTLAAIEAQIAKLTAEAEDIRKREIGVVIGRLKAEIAEYGLTAADLGLDAAGNAAPAKRRKAKAAVASVVETPAPKARKRAKRAAAPAKKASKVKYSDGEHSWTGVGKRPNWFKAAIDAGKTAEDLLV